MGKIGLDGVLGGQLCSWTEKHGEKSSGVGLNRVPGGRGYSWTELYLEIIFGQSFWWTGMQLDRKALGHYVCPESRFSDGQIL